MKVLYTLFFALFFSLTVSAQWTDDVTDNLHVSSTGSADIQSIGLAGGKTWIAFYTQHGGNYDMRAQLLDSTGKKLFGDSGILVSKDTSGSATFVFNVTINGQGDLLIGYQIEIGGELTAIVSRVDQNGNLLWGKGVIVGKGLSPYPAVLSSGETIVAWNNSVSNTVSLQKIASDGSLKFDSAINIKVGSSNTTRGQVIANTNGNFTLVFQKSGFGISTSLYAQRFTRYLKSIWSAPKQLSDATTSAARYYSVIAEMDTTYVGYYSSVGFRFNAYLQRINPDEADALPYGINGSAFSTQTGTNDNYQQTISIALQDSTSNVWAVCTYSDPNQIIYGVYAQRFNKITGNRELSDKAKKVFDVSSNLDTQVGDLQLTGNNEPGFISTDISNKLYVTKLDKQGNIDPSTNRVVLGGTNNPKGRYCFAANDVIAVAVWSEDRGEGEHPFAQNITPWGVTGVLPVILSDFKVAKNGNTANISWNTLNETNNKGFYVERSSDARTFTSIGFVAAKNSGNNAGSSYSFTDKLPLAKNNYYRLQQVDNTGKITYSETILVTFDDMISFAISKLYPNPAKSVVNVEVMSNVASKLTMIITSANGTLVKQQSNIVAAGTQTLPVPVQALSAGTYYLKVMMNGAEKTVKFTKL